MKFAKIFLLTTLIFLTLTSFAQQEDALEVTFDANGKLVSVYGRGEDITMAIAMQDDGTVVVSGSPHSSEFPSNFFQSGWNYGFEILPDGTITGGGWKRKNITSPSSEITKNSVTENTIPISPNTSTSASSEITKNSVTENAISVYPNPSSGEVNLAITEFEDVEIKNIEVYNVSGERILANDFKIITPSNYQIDLSSQPAGSYFIKVSSKKGIVIKKIIKV